jgi:hypothetical protein
MAKSKKSKPRKKVTKKKVKASEKPKEIYAPGPADHSTTITTHAGS